MKGWRAAGFRPPVNRYVGEVLDASPWLEVDVDRQWRACYRIQLQGRRYVIAELRVCPREKKAEPGEWSGTTFGPQAPVPAGGIPSVVFRRLHSRATLHAVAKFVESIHDRLARLGKSEEAAHALLQDRVPPLSRKRGPGRPSVIPRGGYVKFATRYVAIENDRSTRSTRQALAKELGTNEATVSRWIRTCRKRGILTPTEEGKRGGTLAQEFILQRIATEGQTGGRKRV